MTSLVFFGSSEYSLIILDKLLTQPDFLVKLVVTKADKSFGRSQVVTPNPVAQFALNHRLPLLQIDAFTENCKLKIVNSQAQLGLCVAFGPPFFDQDMLNIFPKGIINIHPSPLPKYRGATPGPWQIINGETNSAVTFFQIDPLPDHGPIICQIPFTISPDETSTTFYQKAFTIAAENIHQIISPNRTIQNEAEKSYYPKLTKESGKINWNWDKNKIYHFINAMIPWPIAWTYISAKDGNKLKMKVFSAQLNSGKIEIEKVQIEGKKPTFWSEISSHYSLDFEK